MLVINNNEMNEERRKGEISFYFLKWVEKLGLPSERFKIYPNFELDHDEKGKIASIRYNRDLDKFQIAFYRLAHEREMAHELGHPYFKLQLGIDPFSMRPGEINEEIYDIINAIEDCFVNYRLLKFEEFYELQLNTFLEEIEWDIVEKKYNFYILLFNKPMMFYYGFRENDKKQYEKQFLYWFNNLMRINLIEGNFPISKKKLDKIKNIGEYRFKTLKDTKKAQKYVNFVFDMINVLELFDKEVINQQIYLEYGLKAQR